MPFPAGSTLSSSCPPWRWLSAGNGHTRASFSTLTVVSSIEPSQNGLMLHRNTIGVLTNSPDYIWQSTNLRNFIDVTNIARPPLVIVNDPVYDFSVMFGDCSGLPGSFSSPDRFVRLAFVKQFGVKVAGELNGITQMFRYFAPVEVPKGLMRPSTEKEIYMQTLCISCMCAESGTYYISSSEDRRISAIHLFQNLNSGKIQYFSIPDKQEISYLN